MNEVAVAGVSLTLLGGFQARLGSGPALAFATRKAQALLAYLALRPGQTHPRDKLAALLWGDTQEARARDSLRHTLAALRKALPATTLVTDGATVALNPAAVEVDVARFEQGVATHTPEALERAVSLYRGDLLEGLAVSEPGFEEWLLAERERLRELALEALAKLLAHQTKVGATERAIQTAVRLLALDPLQEVVHRALMRLYARQGRRAAALRQYQVCLGILERELGAEPEAETRRIYQEILRRRASETVTLGAAQEPAAGVGRRQARRTRAKREAGGIALRLALPMEDAPLIGRDLELGRLREALDAAGRGQGRVTMAVGEAGIGKSRLLLALGAEAEGRGARVLVGRCYESEQILPFAPWVDAFRAGRVVTDEEVLGALEPVWRAELGRLLPEVEVPGLPPPSDDQRRLFESVVQLVERLAAVRPVTLLLEDLHWADEMSVRLLSFLGRRVQGWPVLVVATARAEELDDAPALRRVLQELGHERHFMDLGLPPLSAEDTARLVRSLTRVGTSPAAAARLEAAIWRLSEGNPFVVVEAVRALAEGAALSEAASLPLPQRVREVIVGRLEKLSDQSRELATVAAVIGREFEFALVQQAAGLDEREAAEGVEELVRRRVLQGVGEGFDFTHDRIREVAYSRLLSPRRKVLHARVARALEDLYARNLEPHSAALGAHYRNAERWEKAVSYLQRAGALAVRRSAYREAVAFFQQALTALGHVPESRAVLEQAIDLRFDLRNALQPLGELRQILDHLREAKPLAEALQDRRRLGRVFAYMTQYFRTLSQQERAVERGRRALSLAEELGDFPLKVAASAHLAPAFHALGDYREAMQRLRWNVESLKGDLTREPLGMAGLPSVFSLAWLVCCLAEIGEFAEGIARGEEAIRITAAVDYPISGAVTYRALGILHARKGEFHKAIPLLEESLKLCQTRNVHLWSPATASHLGHAYALSGRLAESLPLLEDAVTRAASLGVMFHYPLWVSHLGQAHLIACRLHDSFDLAQRARDLSQNYRERGHEAWALRLLGEIAAQRDPPDVQRAENHYREALALAGDLGMRPLVAHCHQGLGELFAKMDKPAEARAELATAAGLYRAMDMTFWLARAETARFA